MPTAAHLRDIFFKAKKQARFESDREADIYGILPKTNWTSTVKELQSHPSMKSNLLCTLALGIFLVCALYTVWLSGMYFLSVQEMQRLQSQYMSVEQTRNALSALANEALEYSKKNPAIDPILQQFDLKPKPGATNAPAQSGSKPETTGQKSEIKVQGAKTNR